VQETEGNPTSNQLKEYIKTLTAKVVDKEEYNHINNFCLIAASNKLL
jgi:hypothetical protein